MIDSPLKFGFLITAYQQLELTRDNVDRIRNQYKVLKDVPIIIVSNSQEECGFNSIVEQYENIYYLHQTDAPYNNPGYITYRDHYYNIIPRVFMAMQRGSEIAESIGLDIIVHIHSDTYYKPEYEQILLNTFNECKDFMVICDLSQCMIDIIDRDTPHCLAWHPESMFINIKRCRELGYIFCFEDFLSGKYDFDLLNYTTIETIFGEIALNIVTGRTVKDIRSSQDRDEVLRDFQKFFKIGLTRYPHGDFPNGLVNLHGQQPNLYKR